MIKLITYTNDSMTKSANICIQSALRNNVQSTKIWDITDIHREFKERNEEILSNERGCGFWLWKPYIIMRELCSKELKDGDILIYSDAGVEIINNVHYITDNMKEDIFLFGNMYQHLHWCKADVIAAINKKKQVFDKQVQASVIFFRKSEASIQFVEEWLKNCVKPGFIDDSESKIKNHPEFREHRHDQAILTCLAYKYKFKLHWWPSIYNAGMFTYDHSGYDDKYPAIFHHHRFRNNQFSNSFGVDYIINTYFRQKKYSCLLS